MLSSYCTFLLHLFCLTFMSLVLIRGTRPSSSQPLLISTPSPSGTLNQKTDACNGPVAFSNPVPSQVSSLQNDTGKKNVPDEESTISLEKSKIETFGPVKKELDADGSIISDTSMTSLHLASVPLSSQLHSPPRTKSLLNTSNIFDSSASSSGLASMDYIDNNVENVCSDILSLSIEENQHLKNDDVEHIREPSICQTSEELKNTTDVVHIASVQSDCGRSDQVTEVDLPELDDDLLSFHTQRIKDPEIASSRAPDFLNSGSNYPAFDNTNGLIGIGFDRQVVDRSSNLTVSTSNIPSVYLENIFNNGADDSNLFLRKEKMSPVGRYEPEVGSGAVDIGESSIISNILSMDFDSWDEPVTSSQNLSKFLGETNRRQGSFGVPGSWKTQNSGQSRFSFAREEEAVSHLFHPEQSNDHEHALKQRLFGHNYSISNRLHLEKSGSIYGLPISCAVEQDYFASNHSHISSNKHSGNCFCKFVELIFWFYLKFNIMKIYCEDCCLFFLVSEDLCNLASCSILLLK